MFIAVAGRMRSIYIPNLMMGTFMKIDELNNDKLMWYVIFHMTFVLSALLLAVLDKIAFSEHREHQ